MNQQRTSPLAMAGAVIFSTGLLLLTTACGNEPPAPLSTFADHCKKENKNKRIALEGFVKPTGLTFCKTSCTTGLFARRMQEGRGSARVSLRIRGRNGMERLKKRYRRADFTIYDKEGNAIKYGTPARLHGRLAYSDFNKKEPPTCWIKVDLIEKTSYKEKTPKPVTVPFGQFCADKFDKAYVTMTGLIKLPSSMFCRGGCKLNLVPAAGGSPIPARFQLGNEAHHMGRLPRRYNASMLKLFDANKKPADLTRPVRLEGTIKSWESSSEKKKKCELLVERVIQ